MGYYSLLSGFIYTGDEQSKSVIWRSLKAELKKVLSNPLAKTVMPSIDTHAHLKRSFG